MTQRGSQTVPRLPLRAALPRPATEPLLQDYPGWDIAAADGRWTARLRRRRTSALARAGISAVIAATHAGDLVAWLGHEVMRLQATCQAEPK
ncbi:hypothetical protein [Nonomuraea endophytica]|uniref:hypothetical protein n=1 Tax=Nonomuraea endophytica TaxID=714136 RepID=UPI0037CA6BDB